MKTKIILLIIFFSLFSFSAVSFAKDKILIIESYHRDYEWDISYKNGLKEVLGDKYDYLSFQMDTKRLPRKLFPKRADMAYRIFLKEKPVLVVLGDDNALKYVGPKFIGSDAYVVYLGVNNNPRYYGMAGHKNISGVLERPIMRRSIMHMSRFVPMSKALILFDSGVTANVLKSEVFSEASSVRIGNIQVDIECIGNYEKWKSSVKNSALNGYDVIFVGLYQTLKDENKRHVPENEVIRWTSKNTPVPIFGFWDFSVGADKTIGGYVLLASEQGRQAGQLALRFLRQSVKRPLRPIVAERGRFIFSRAQLKKWKIDVGGDIEYTFKD